MSSRLVNSHFSPSPRNSESGKKSLRNTKVRRNPGSACQNLLVFGENGRHLLYPSLYEVIQIVATLPVTVASCERAHSKVKLVSNYLRASMADDRLENLVRIRIERDISNKIELCRLMDIFKTTDQRKLLLQLEW